MQSKEPAVGGNNITTPPPGIIGNAQSFIAPLNTGSYTDRGQLRALVVDDERQVRVACEAIARSAGFVATSVGSGAEALQAVAHEPFDVVLMDVRMPGVSGLDLLETLLAQTPASYVIMMTGYASVESAVEAMKKGAYHYIRKPFHIDELRIVLQRIEAEIQASAEARMWRSQVNTSCAFGRMIGSTGPMQQVFRLAARASARVNPLLLVGEKGTGKELIARCIHDCSDRREKPFVVIECDSGNPEKILAEVRAAAEAGSEGTAEGGSLLLKEISSMPMEAQAVIFRMLDNQQTPGPNVRLMATTSQELEPLAKRGEFRQNLLYRLSVFILRMPPLRDRASDIPALVDYFLDLDAANTGRKVKISDQALRTLMRFPWPGNIRQLRNCVERATANLVGTNLKATELPAEVRDWKEDTQPVVGAPVVETLAEAERRAVLAAMKFAKGDKMKAAQLLGIGRTTLYRKLEEYK
jgi:two-component system response regulator HydG